MSVSFSSTKKSESVTLTDNLSPLKTLQRIQGLFKHNGDTGFSDGWKTKVFDYNFLCLSTNQTSYVLNARHSGNLKFFENKDDMYGKLKSFVGQTDREVIDKFLAQLSKSHHCKVYVEETINTLKKKLTYSIRKKGNELTCYFLSIELSESSCRDGNY